MFNQLFTLSVRLPVNGRLSVVVLGEVKSSTWVFNCTKGRHPKPFIVQVSTIHELQLMTHVTFLF